MMLLIEVLVKKLPVEIVKVIFAGVVLNNIYFTRMEKLVVRVVKLYLTIVFCVENLPKKFIRGEYRNHLEQQMIDLEKSKLPECMPYVKDYMTLIKYQDAKIKMIDYVNSQIQTKKMEIVYPKMIEFIKLCNERGCVKCSVCGEEDDGYVIIPRNLSGYIRHSDYAQILSLLPDNLKKDRFYNFTHRCKKCDGIKKWDAILFESWF